MAPRIVTQADVRNGVRDWIAQAVEADLLPGIVKVFKAVPWWFAGQWLDFAADGTRTYGAGLFVHIAGSTETRITLPAPNPLVGRTIDDGFVGEKNVVYDVQLGIMYQYLIPSALIIDPLLAEDDPRNTIGDQWVDGLDAIIDALKQHIREDPTLGHPEWVFQAAQTPDSLTIQQDSPTLASGGGAVTSFAALSFPLDTIVTA